MTAEQCGITSSWGRNVWTSALAGTVSSLGSTGRSGGEHDLDRRIGQAVEDVLDSLRLAREGMVLRLARTRGGATGVAGRSGAASGRSRRTSPASRF